MNRNIEPTHTCFDDAIEMLPEMPDKLLVHALCRPKFVKEDSSKDLMSHAWLEDGMFVYTVGIENNERKKFCILKATYYGQMRPYEITRYTIREAAEMNWKHRTYGPWEEKYLKGCNDYVEA